MNPVSESAVNPVSESDRPSVTEWLVFTGLAGLVVWALSAAFGH